MAETREALTMRLDRFLWWARIVKTRDYAQGLAHAGHLRIDGRPVDRAAAPVRVGNILTFATHRGEIRVIRVEALPARRGPPAEALACYQDLSSVRPELVEGQPRIAPVGFDKLSPNGGGQELTANDSQESRED